MASVTFSSSVGGDDSTVTDDDDASTGLENGGHRARFVPALAQTVAVASNTVTKATEAATSASNAATSESNAATSASNAASSESNAATSETNAAASASAASTSETNAAASESNAASSESNASTSETNAAASAAAAAASATAAEASADGLLGRRTVTSVSGVVTVGDDQSGYHYRAADSEYNELRLDKGATVGVTVHMEASGGGLVHFAVDNGGNLRARGNRSWMTERYGVVTATKVTSTDWVVAGDLGDVTTSTDDYEHDDNNLYVHDTGETYQNTIVSAA